MTRMRRFLLVSALGLALAASSATEPRAQEVATGPDTAAVAVNTKDGSTLFRITFQIIRNPGDVVDNVNAAVAWASCEGCTTIAGSFQVLLVTGDPSVVTPENIAIAINFECIDCQTLASAYQFVKSTDGQAVFTPEGRAMLSEIRQALTVLRRNVEQMTIFEIQAELDRLAEQLAQVLANELVAVTPDLRLEVRLDEVDEGVEAGEPTQAPSVDTGISSPAETTSPTPAGSPTGSPAPTENSSPEASPSSPSVSPSPTSVSPSPTSTG